jgi:Flp pilus assembly protein TadG
MRHPKESAMRHHQNSFQQGQILILAAFALIVLIGFVGLAIDAGRAYGVKAKLNSAVDAASIAGARALAEGADDSVRIAAARQAAKDFYAANFPANFLGATAVPMTDGMIQATHEPSGYWTVNVTGSAKMPRTITSIFGLGDTVVGAAGTTIRRDLDVILVLDTSGSLLTPSDTLPKLKAAAINFVSLFNSGSNGDRVGVVSYASGGVVDVAIVKTGVRGFDKTLVVSKINALTVTGSTAAAEGLRLALNEINGVPVASRSSQRSIVVFSDGAPNDVPAIFCNNSIVAGACKTTGDLVAGDLYSETDNSARITTPTNCKTTLEPCRIYFSEKRDCQKPNNNNCTQAISNWPNIVTLPSKGFLLKDESQIDIPNSGISLASYNNKRTLSLVTPVNGSSFPYTNTRCNVNKAARNMVENVANTARGQSITIHSIGLGQRVNSQEITFCSYGTNEYGRVILKRLANAADSDTRNDTQPTGLYAWAETASELDNAFSTIASEILRLSR